MPPDHVFAHRYRLLDRLGAGGMSVVWRAHDDVLDRPVAVKVISDSADPQVCPRLQTEARAAGALCHPGIAQIFDYGEAEGPDGAREPYLVMELVDGVPLDRQLAGGAQLPWQRAVAICTVLADALTEMHARGLVHRDIKPANVIVTPRGPKLVDFGICASVGEADAQDGQLMGTPAYVAPERITDAPVGPESDVYALGMLLYRMVSGELPWPKDSSTGLLKAHLFSDPRPVTPVDGLPAEVAVLVMRCLDKDPPSRPSAAEIATTLHRVDDPAVEAAGRDAQRPADAPGPDENGLTRPLAPAAAGSTAPHTPGWRQAHLTVLASTPLRDRRPRSAGIAVLALLALGLLFALWHRQDRSSPEAAGAHPAGATAPGCSAVFAVQHDSGKGFDAAVTVHNGSAEPAGWSVSFAFPGGQKLTATDPVPAQVTTASHATQVVAVVLRQNGGRVSAVASGAALPAGSTAALPAGSTVQIPISGSYQQSNPLPTAVSLGTQLCSTQVVVAPGATPATSSAAGPAPPAPPTPGVGGDDKGKGKGKGKGGP